MDRKFKIDVFELGFLAEVCIPRVPIARSMFWHDMIDMYYHQMSREEADRLYEWISRNPRYEDSIEKGYEDTLIFDARYNPECQFRVTTNYKDKIETSNLFLYQDRYYKSRNVSILEKYITKVEKL